MDLFLWFTFVRFAGLTERRWWLELLSKTTKSTLFLADDECYTYDTGFQLSCSLEKSEFCCWLWKQWHVVRSVAFINGGVGRAFPPKFSELGSLVKILLISAVALLLYTYYSLCLKISGWRTSSTCLSGRSHFCHPYGVDFYRPMTYRCVALP